MNVYITGIAGFLGSHLADYLLAQGHQIYGCDDLSTGDIQNVPVRVKLWAKTSIEQIQAAYLAVYKIDVLYHCAAAAYEGVSHFSPAFISRNIYAGSAAVFSAAITAGVKRIVTCSSMARYGELPGRGSLDVPAPAVFHEELPTRPVDPYGIAKEAVDRLLINLCETHDVEYAIAVPHNIFGPRQRYVDPFRNVAAIFANRILQGFPPIIYGDGHQIRCFSYIDDVVPSLARMGFDPAANGELINIGPDQGAVSILTLARMLNDIIGADCEPIFLPSRPREVKYAVCSSDKARRILGFEQATELRDGLIKLVAFIRERGPRPFEYHLPLEIESPLTPRTWVSRSM